MLVIGQANAGPAVARNSGLRAVSGKFITFLDSDDTWHPEFLGAMVNALEEHPDAAIAYFGWQNSGRSGTDDTPYVPADYESCDKLQSLLRGCPWPIHAALARTKLIRGAGGFDETLSSCMDYDLWLRLGCVQRLVRVPRVLAVYHRHEGKQIADNKAQIALNTLRVKKKYLAASPAELDRLGQRRVRQLTDGDLLYRGYDACWERDLSAARTLFREVMRYGYGSTKVWTYMLPSWLPETCHRWLTTGLGGTHEYIDSHG